MRHYQNKNKAKLFSFRTIERLLAILCLSVAACGYIYAVNQNTASVYAQISSGSTDNYTAAAQEDNIMDKQIQSETDAQIIPVSVSGIENNYYNVKSYGAVGDGQTDDTEAIRKAINNAYAKNGTAYFPKGTYLISDTITLQKNDTRKLLIKGDGESVLIGAETLTGNILTINMKYNFFITDMQLEHRGVSGSTVNAVYISALHCKFRALSSENKSNLVEFHGSDCKINSCSFETANPESYAIYYSMLNNEISINDYIIDSYISGCGRGILVGDGKYTASGRCEGLKINGNTFENTGDSQIVIQEILHIDISGNKMSHSGGSAIVLRRKGHGADGIFINNNNITAAVACIRSEQSLDNYISMVDISSNILSGGQYGFYDPIGVNKSFIRENRFENQSVAGILLNETKNMVILSNQFFEENAFSMDITGSGDTIIQNNEITGKAKVTLSGENTISDIK